MADPEGYGIYMGASTGFDVEGEFNDVRGYAVAPVPNARPWFCVYAYQPRACWRVDMSLSLLPSHTHSPLRYLTAIWPLVSRAALLCGARRLRHVCRCRCAGPLLTEEDNENCVDRRRRLHGQWPASIDVNKPSPPLIVFAETGFKWTRTRQQRVTHLMTAQIPSPALADAQAFWVDSTGVSVVWYSVIFPVSGRFVHNLYHTHHRYIGDILSFHATTEQLGLNIEPYVQPLAASPLYFSVGADR